MVSPLKVILFAGNNSLNLPEQYSSDELALIDHWAILYSNELEPVNLLPTGHISFTIAKAQSQRYRFEDAKALITSFGRSTYSVLLGSGLEGISRKTNSAAPRHLISPLIPNNLVQCPPSGIMMPLELRISHFKFPRSHTVRVSTSLLAVMVSQTRNSSCGQTKLVRT